MVNDDFVERDLLVQKRMLQSEERYRNLLELLPEALLVVTGEEIVFANVAAAALIGSNGAEQLIGLSLFRFVSGEDIPSLRKQLQRFLHEGGSSESTVTGLVRMNQSVIEVEARAVPMFFLDKPSVLILYTDIPGRKPVKEILYEKAEEIIRQSEKLSVVGQLAAGIAHEIRNPLTSLRGFTQLLRKKVWEYESYFDIMLTELERINLIVNEFMVIAKPSAIHFQNNNLTRIVREVAVFIESQAILSNVQIILHEEDKLPLIKSDENQLKQVFINLLKNAIEAMPIGGEIHIYIFRCSADEVLIRIVDQGYGIPEAKIGRLGEPFFTTKPTGSGLGLMVSLQIIDKHNGRIEFHSEENAGTTVDVVLPCEQDKYSVE